MKSDDQTLQIEITIVPAKDRRGGRCRNPAEPTVPEPPRIPRITRLMALAIKFQDMVDRGEVRDYADLARLGFVTRARLTQIMNLLKLSPAIQESLIFLKSNDGDHRPVAERQIRLLTPLAHWADQEPLASAFLRLRDRDSLADPADM
jgi:hypothetical protein